MTDISQLNLAENLTDEFDEQAPDQDAITPYDETHFALYLELLHAEGEGSSLDQMAKETFRLDPAKEPGRSEAIVTSHLRRAHWFCGDGARHLLD
jgi:hypothetical protein